MWRERDKIWQIIRSYPYAQLDQSTCKPVHDNGIPLEGNGLEALDNGELGNPDEGWMRFQSKDSWKGREWANAKVANKKHVSQCRKRKGWRKESSLSKMPKHRPRWLSGATVITLEEYMPGESFMMVVEEKDKEEVIYSYNLIIVNNQVQRWRVQVM